MAKFTKPFKGCKKGEIYPTDFKVGDDCPAELERAAKSVGAIPSGEKTSPQGAGKGEGKPGA